MQTKIYIACVRPLEEPQLYKRFLAETSQERKEKISRFRFEKNRLLSLGAEVLLRRALREAGHFTGTQETAPPQNGHPLKELVYAYGNKGKPYLPDLPDFHFNWSHAGEYVMLAVSDREVGCDVEEIRPIELKLPRFALEPREYEQVAACEGAERDELFFRYWVLKESYMKATGEGLGVGTTSFHIELEPPIRVIRDGALQNFSFLEGGDIPGYRYAMCVEGALPEVQIETVDLRSVTSEPEN